MEKHIKSPFTGGEAILITEKITATVKKIKIEMEVPAYKCLTTGKTFTTGEMNDAYVDELHHLYREQLKLPTVDQLIERRKHLGLKQNEMSRLLGFGINQYRNYELGELPSGAHALLLRGLMNFMTLHELVEMQIEFMPGKTKKKLRKWLDNDLVVVKGSSPAVKTKMDLASDLFLTGSGLIMGKSGDSSPLFIKAYEEELVYEC